MSFLRALHVELRKLITLPSGWAGLAVTVLGTAAIAVLNGSYARSDIASGDLSDLSSLSPFDVGYSAMPLGTVGAVVLGVIAVGSEYSANSTDAGGGRQIAATLTAMPGRVRVILAKALAMILLVLISALVAIPLSTAIAAVMLGDDAVWSAAPADILVRSAGAAAYWSLSGVMALAIATLARSVLIPLVVLIANSSVVSVSILLSNLTPLAYWLPDLAGSRLFGDLSMDERALDAVPGSIVMALWAAALLGAATVAFARREA